MTAWDVVRGDLKRLLLCPLRLRFEARTLAAATGMLAIIAAAGCAAFAIASAPGALLLWWIGWEGERLVVGSALIGIPVIVAVNYAMSVADRTKAKSVKR